MPEPVVRAWLEEDLHTAVGGQYWHRLLVERDVGRSAAVVALKSLVYQAHEDARRYLRAAFADTLDPLDDPGSADVATAYPSGLSLQTLYGYFGEVLAGIVAEHFVCCGRTGWVVPAYLFRFHVLAFQELERVRQGQRPTAALPGRTGDDCLAFIRAPDGAVVSTLVCEAKCTTGHHSGMIADAHVKVSEELRVPVDLAQLIHVLEDRESAEATAWVHALRVLLIEGPRAADYEAMNLVVYVCGRRPRSKGSWIPRDAAHDKYTGSRRLEAVEAHLTDVEQLVRLVYGKS